MGINIEFTLNTGEKRKVEFAFNSFHQLEICHVSLKRLSLLKEIKTKCSEFKGNYPNHIRTMLAFNMNVQNGFYKGELASVMFQNSKKKGKTGPLVQGESVVQAKFF